MAEQRSTPATDEVPAARGQRSGSRSHLVGRPTVLCDLDGVVWLAHQPIDGSVAAIEDLRARGHRVMFVTNNSFATRAEQESALAAIGVSARGDVVTSAMAAARLVERGCRALVLGGPGVVEELEMRDVEIVPGDAVDGGALVDTVVVGFHRTFDYDAMRRAAVAIRAGARFVGTNEDATYPTPSGPIPGGGAILAAVATASGAVPNVAGKPHAPMAELVRELVGSAIDRAVMVGDRPSTDGRFAREIGCRFALVLSGVTASGVGVDPAPDLVAPDLAGVASVLLAEPSATP